jgi:hypothetical protein
MLQANPGMIWVQMKKLNTSVKVSSVAWVCSGTESTITEATYWPNVPVLDDECGVVVGMNDWQEKPKYSEKSYPSAAQSATDST